MAAVSRIPPGRVATYGQVATQAGLPGRARLVGWALRRFGEEVPWWRVVNAAGRVSARGDPEGEREQGLRLAREGVPVGSDGRLDLGRWRWTPRAAGSRRGRDRG